MSEKLWVNDKLSCENNNQTLDRKKLDSYVKDSLKELRWKVEIDSLFTWLYDLKEKFIDISKKVKSWTELNWVTMKRFWNLLNVYIVKIQWLKTKDFVDLYWQNRWIIESEIKNLDSLVKEIVSLFLNIKEISDNLKRKECNNLVDVTIKNWESLSQVMVKNLWMNINDVLNYLKDHKKDIETLNWIKSIDKVKPGILILPNIWDYMMKKYSR